MNMKHTLLFVVLVCAGLGAWRVIEAEAPHVAASEESAPKPAAPLFREEVVIADTDASLQSLTMVVDLELIDQPLREVVAHLDSLATQVSFVLSSSVDRERLITFVYHGPLNLALDELVTVGGFKWDVVGKTVLLVGEGVSFSTRKLTVAYDLYDVMWGLAWREGTLRGQLEAQDPENARQTDSLERLTSFVSDACFSSFSRDLVEEAQILSSRAGVFVVTAQASDHVRMRTLVQSLRTNLVQTK